MATTPFCKPLTVGPKVTLTVQFAPAARLVPQVFVWEKSPPAITALILAAAAPLFVKMTDWAALVPTACRPKLRLAVDTFKTW